MENDIDALAGAQEVCRPSEIANDIFRSLDVARSHVQDPDCAVLARVYQLLHNVLAQKTSTTCKLLQMPVHTRDGMHLLRWRSPFASHVNVALTV